MLTILELAPHVLGYHVDGSLEAGDIDRVFSEIDQKLTVNDRISVYAEVHSLSGMTIDALWKDLKLSAGHLGTLKRISRAALVTDIGWLRTAGGMENRFVPGIEVRVFPMSQQLEARHWIAS